MQWQRKKLGKGSYSAIATDAEDNPHVVFNREAGTGFILTHAWAKGSRWFSETVDDNPNIGYGCDLAIDGNGGLHVSYRAEGLRYAQNHGSGWQTEVLEPGGLSSSILIDEEGAPRIVHVSDLGVRYLKQTSSGWESETIAPNGLSFGGTSLQLRDDKVYVTFSDDSLPRKLYLASLDADVWSLEQIDEGYAGSMALTPDGVPHVVYRNEAVNELRHAWLTSSGWLNETLVSASAAFGEQVPTGLHAIGEYPALVADSAGRLQLATGLYLSKGDASTEALVAASFDGASWTPSAIAVKRIGYNNSIAIDSNDIVHISTRQSLGDDASVIHAVRLKGRKLSISVIPPAAGVISAAPSGLECSAKCSEFLYPGAEVTLTAVPAPGFTFRGWSKDGSGTGPSRAVTMDKNRKVVARFAALPP